MPCRMALALRLDSCFEEACKLLEVRAGLNKAHIGTQVFSGDNFRKGHKCNVKLAVGADHLGIAPFGHGAKAADTELAAQHYVKGVGGGTARFVAELHRSDFFSSRLYVSGKARLLQHRAFCPDRPCPAKYDRVHPCPWRESCSGGSFSARPSAMTTVPYFFS